LTYKASGSGEATCPDPTISSFGMEVAQLLNKRYVKRDLL